jgi:peptidoglycan/LPS O-acetylase OafA/YrhL
VTATTPADAVPAVRPHFALFDALRGIAVVAVITFHVASITGAMGGGLAGEVAQVLGAQAVIVFFVISGFLLYRPFVAARAAGRPMPDLARYGRRRVGRIVPAYWVALTVMGVFPALAGVFTGDFWRYYGFLQLYDDDTFGRGIPVAWTLCVEVTFYLLLPLWALMARRWRFRGDLVALAVVGLGGAVLQVLAAQRDVPRLLADSLPGQMCWLTIGMALAVWSVAAAEGPRIVVRRPELCWAGAIAALAGLVALVPEGGLFALVVALTTPQPLGDAIGKVLLSAALAVLFVLPGVFGERAGGLPRRILRFAPVAFLGTVSYSLYLYHLPVAQLLGLREDPYHFEAEGLGLVERLDVAVTPILLALTLLVSAAIAAVSYRWVERPFFKPGGREPARAAGAAPSGATGG